MKLKIANDQHVRFIQSGDYKVLVGKENNTIKKEHWCDYITVYKR